MRRRGKHLEVSTFPFLAVLLCAMGSLILVLLVMDRKAKLASRYKALAAQAKVADDQAKADAARLDLIRQYEAEAKASWEQKRDNLHTSLLTQQQMLQAQMKKIQDDLAGAAARLKAELDESGELKDRVRSEKTNLVGEEKALAAIRKELADTTAKTAADRAAQAKMTADLLQLETALRDLREARERDKQTYSVVPYRGKHGENRRPLYVECTRQGVVFHPERVEVAVGSNPAGARAEVERRVARQREYLASIQAKADDKPYLMLLIRPDGISAYYEVQNALRGIDLEFGYEFVDAAWVFDFSKDVDLPPGKPPLVTGPKSPSPSVVSVGRGGSAVVLLPSDTTTTPGTRPDDGLGGPRPGSLIAPGSGGVGSGTDQLNPLPPNRQGSSGPAPNGQFGPSVGPGNATGAGGPTPGTRAASTIPSIVYSPMNGATGSGGAGKVMIPGAAGSPPLPIPAIPQVPNVGATGATSPVRMDPPFGAAKTKTDFATQGDHRPGGGGSVGPEGSGSNGGTAPAATSPAAGTQGLSLAPGVTGAGATGQPNAGSQPASGGQPSEPSTPAEKNKNPQYAPVQTQPPVKKPPALRVAKLNGDRDFVIFIECRPDEVVLYPSRQSFPVQDLARGDTALNQAVKQMIDRKQSLVRPGEMAFRPQVRFLVHPESIRSYHTAYPLLNALGVPQTRQNLEPDDDVAAIVVGQ